jgi:hypothetical protein
MLGERNFFGVFWSLPNGEVSYSPNVPIQNSVDNNVLDTGFVTSGDNVSMSLNGSEDLLLVLSSDSSIKVIEKGAPLDPTPTSTSDDVDDGRRHLLNAPENKNEIYSQSGSVVVGATKLSAIGTSVVSFNAGISFMKFFQVVEIFSKLIYFPVIFEGQTQQVLLNMHDLAEPVDIPPDLLIKDTYTESVTSYDRKITVYKEPPHIL